MCTPVFSFVTWSWTQQTMEKTKQVEDQNIDETFLPEKTKGRDVG